MLVQRLTAGYVCRGDNVLALHAVEFAYYQIALIFFGALDHKARRVGRKVIIAVDELQVLTLRTFYARIAAGGYAAVGLIDYPDALIAGGKRAAYV